MAKKLGIVIVLLVPLLFYIWWYLQVPLSPGIYPEKHVGLELLEVEKETVMIPIKLPVRWVKLHPWQEAPVIHEVSLFDEDGEIIAALGGDYRIKIPYQHKWTERNISGEIELYLNGARLAEAGGITTTAIDRYLQSDFAVSRVEIVLKGERNKYPIEQSYRYQIVEKSDQILQNGWEQMGLMNFYPGQNLNIPEGLIVRLVGTKGHQLEQISFWLPGMDETYYESKVQYKFGAILDDYMNTTEPFTGEKLSLPLKMEESSVVIYFPYTEEIIAKTEQSLVRLSPNFFFTNPKGESYLHGGSWSIGSLNFKYKYQNLVVVPKKE